MVDRSVRVESGWVSGAVVAGLIGTAVAGMVVLMGFLVAQALAGWPGSVGAAFGALTTNVAARTVADRLALAVLLHFAIGLALSVVYAGVVEPRLAGPGARRGMLFALAPWLLSLVLVLPLLGGGLLGLQLGAGVLPVVGNLVAHLAYGGVLGWAYERGRAELRDEDEASALANLGAERGMAVGAVAGAALGALVTGATAPAWFGAGTPVIWAAMLGAIGGAVVGAFLGSFAGLGRPTHPSY